VTRLARWALAAGAAAAVAVLPGAASAAAAPSPATGNDVSYPQCASNFPTGAAFGVVGVNDGIANTGNPCLGAEIAWASGTSGGAGSSYGSAQPKAQLYVNTADPGDVYNGQRIADWPSDNTGGGTDPYGACTATVVSLSKHKTTTAGQNSPACAWQYGWNAATKDVQIFFHNAVSAQGSLDQNAADYSWWLDVETGNTWQSARGGGLAMNDAVLEGMVATLSTLSPGGPAKAVGIYSTGYQWNQITGGESTVDGNWSGSAHGAGPAPLDGQPDWVPGATSSSGAVATCTGNVAFTRTGTTSANVTLAQWFSGGFDGDVSC
jgi:hypothetical protein